MALSGPHGKPPLWSQPIRHRHRHTCSDESISTFLPRPVKPPHLQTISSGKESLNPIQLSQLQLADMDGAIERKSMSDIVPGLRKRRSEGDEKKATRRYLSEAWRFIDDEERRKVLGDWSVLANGDERDVKEQLRQWAHVVALSRPFGEG